jgi:hypothetical protein
MENIYTPSAGKHSQPPPRRLEKARAFLDSLYTPEQSPFIEQEQMGEQIYDLFTRLGIWEKLYHQGDLLEPAVRCAQIACRAAQKLNAPAEQAGGGMVVSPRTTFYVGPFFKAGQAVDETLAREFCLDELDPRALGLYKYPAYARERSTASSNVLKLALLLKQCQFDWFARAILHGPHPNFFEEAELATILASLANANIARNAAGEWHSYLHPAINLLAIEPYASSIDELPPREAKDWVDRSHMTAINTTLQHVLRIHAGIEFYDESYGDSAAELEQRWTVVKTIFKELGIVCPSPLQSRDQQRKNTLLARWIEENDIPARLHRPVGHTLAEHSQMVSDLMEYIASQINEVSLKVEQRPLLDSAYMGNIGLVHDAPKAFSDEEKSWLLSLCGYEKEFQGTYPPEVNARGTISLTSSYDAQLYAWLRFYEDASGSGAPSGQFEHLGDDLLSGPYHLRSLVSTLLSYADLAVISKDGLVFYQPDITERFLKTTLKYISDPHSAVIGYAKLMTAAASLSWYLGIKMPTEGSTSISVENSELLTAHPITNQAQARSNLQNVARVLKIFGAALPLELRKLCSQ